MHPGILALTLVEICLLSFIGGPHVALADDLISIITEMNEELLFLDDDLQCPEDTKEEARYCSHSVRRSKNENDQCRVSKEIFKCLYSGLVTCKNGEAIAEAKTDQVNDKLRSMGCSPFSVGKSMVPVSSPLNILLILTFVLLRHRSLLYTV